MKLPFVTRSHFDDVTAELREQLSEQKRLNTNLLAYIGIVPREQSRTEPEQAVAEQDPISQYVGRNRRMSSVIHAAEKKLTEKFREKYPITSELDELEAKGRALAHGS